MPGLCCPSMCTLMLDLTLDLSVYTAHKWRTYRQLLVLPLNSPPAPGLSQTQAGDVFWHPPSPGSRAHCCWRPSTIKSLGVRLPHLQISARLSPSVLPLPLLTCHGSHPCCNSATDSRGPRPTPWCRRGTYHHPLPSLGHRHTAHPSCRTSTAQGTRGITSPTALRSMLIDHTSLFDHRGGGSA